jgi:hypothetical protein
LRVQDVLHVLDIETILTAQVALYNLFPAYFTSLHFSPLPVPMLWHGVTGF